jgi:hypothetical protein
LFSRYASILQLLFGSGISQKEITTKRFQKDIGFQRNSGEKLLHSRRTARSVVRRASTPPVNIAEQTERRPLMYIVIDTEDKSASPSPHVPTMAAAELLVKMMSRLTGRTYKIVNLNPPAASEPEKTEPEQ